MKTFNRTTIFILSIIASLIICVAVIYTFYFNNPWFIINNNLSSQKGNTLTHQKNTPEEKTTEPEKKPSEPIKVKGLYLTGWSAGNPARMDHFINLLNNTELNALVIDVKDDLGRISYPSKVPLAKAVGANKSIMVKDISSVLAKLKKNNIYTIARIVVFKDSNLALNKPSIALKNKKGHVWLDNKDTAWLDPFNPDSWQYSIDLAKEAAQLGFDEIQFDYVRFPSDGNINDIKYSTTDETLDKTKPINEFLAHARKELAAFNVPISADIFGIVTTNPGDDEKIGQDLNTICLNVDYLSPMVYPSHYAVGQYNIKKPDLEPYKVVFTSMSTAKKRLDLIKGDKAKLRPYLQDFTAVWLGKSYYKKYTAADVESQIKAVYDSGLDEWILWNAGNKYSETAFKKEPILK